MKKLLTLVFTMLAICAMLANTSDVSAQPILGGYCCDASMIARCQLDDFYPVGNACYCYQRGWGSCL